MMNTQSSPSKNLPKLPPNFQEQLEREKPMGANMPKKPEEKKEGPHSFGEAFQQQVDQLKKIVDPKEFIKQIYGEKKLTPQEQAEKQKKDQEELMRLRQQFNYWKGEENRHIQTKKQEERQKEQEEAQMKQEQQRRQEEERRRSQQAEAPAGKQGRGSLFGKKKKKSQNPDIQYEQKKI